MCSAENSVACTQEYYLAAEIVETKEEERQIVRWKWVKEWDPVSLHMVKTEEGAVSGV